jgi:hypothetical protein
MSGGLSVAYPRKAITSTLAGELLGRRPLIGPSSPSLLNSDAGDNFYAKTLRDAVRRHRGVNVNVNVNVNFDQVLFVGTHINDTHT